MTIPTMSCELFAGGLADFLEHDVDEMTRAGMEAHALSCAECGALLADLRALSVDAASLPELVPSRDLWAGIATRIETPVVELKHTRNVAGASGGTKVRQWLRAGLAAAGLVAITATVTRELTMRTVIVGAPSGVVAKSPERTDKPVTAAKSDPAPVQEFATAKASTPSTRRPTAATPTTLVANRPSAQQTYETEIANLRAVLNDRRPQLDSATVAVVEFNLKVIDNSIAQCKQALRKDPASRFLMESLNDAMDNKVQLLRTAAALPSRM